MKPKMQTRVRRIDGGALLVEKNESSRLASLSLFRLVLVACWRLLSHYVLVSSGSISTTDLASVVRPPTGRLLPDVTIWRFGMKAIFFVSSASRLPLAQFQRCGSYSRSTCLKVSSCAENCCIHGLFHPLFGISHCGVPWSLAITLEALFCCPIRRFELSS